MTIKTTDTPIEIDIDLDPTRPIRDAQPEDARRRSKLMEVVRSVIVRTHRDVQLRDAFDELLENLAERKDCTNAHSVDTRPEGELLVVLGASGAGKSTAIERLILGHPLTDGKPINHPGSRIISVTAPDHANKVELGRETLRALGYPLRRKQIDGPEIWRMVRDRVRSLQILVLHFDEMQHVVQTVNDVEMQKIRNVLKGLMVDRVHPVGIVVSGTPDVRSLIDADEQVERRGCFLEFGSLSAAADGRMIGNFVKVLAERAELTVDKPEIDKLVPRLIHAGRRQLGIVAKQIHRAIRFALRQGDKQLTTEHFANAYALRTGNLAPYNPYLADRWKDLDTSKVLVTSEEIDPEIQHPRSKKRKGASK